MRLYGNDMDETTTVLEAGLGWMVGWTKTEPFTGAEALRAEKASGPARRLVGLEMLDRAIARQGYPVLVDGEPVGRVTSGTHTPFLKKAIAMAYVPSWAAEPGRVLEVEIRGRRAAARVAPMPFYKRPRS
jgi:aminomethyltransferase